MKNPFLRFQAAVVIAALVAPGAISTTLAQPSPTAQGPDDRAQRQADAAKTQREAFEAFARGDFAAAEQALLQQRALDPDNFVVHYNLACALSMQNKPGPAAESLLRAVSKGFVDREQLVSDQQLWAVRDHEAYLFLVENWDKILTEHRDSNIRLTKNLFKGRYSYTNDDNLRITLASAFDETSTKQAYEELRLIAKWARKTLFPDLQDPDIMIYDPWVVVVLPSRKDFIRWTVATYGINAINDFNQIGGGYDHDSKRLITQDLGATLRHEYLHVLHWRDNTRKKQSHPIWIQEGLCSLVEDYDIDQNGNLVPVPSWRTNIVANLERVRKLPSIKDLATMSRMNFTASRPLAHYAMARSIFLFLQKSGKLSDWYSTYQQTHNEDRTGILALEKVFEQPIDEINTNYRAWIRSLPKVPEAKPSGIISGLNVSIGVELDPGEGDGPAVAVISRSGPAYKAGIRRHDVITHIDSRPTRDMNEFIRVLASYHPGEEVEISYRRRARHNSVKVVPNRR